MRFFILVKYPLMNTQIITRVVEYEKTQELSMHNIFAPGLHKNLKLRFNVVIRDEKKITKIASKQLCKFKYEAIRTSEHCRR